MSEPKSAIVNFFVFITSFSILAYEINFTRIFAYAQWHNLSALIITMALLGFGASGSVIAMVQKKIEPNLLRYLYAVSLLFPVSLCIGFIVSAQLDFNPYEMTLSLDQALDMVIYFALMGIGFFLGACVICMALMRYKVSFTYFINLTGSAAGVLFVLCASFFIHPYDVMLVIILISLVPACLVALEGSMKINAGAAVLLTVVTLIISVCFFDLKQVSQYKPVSGALTLPDAKIVHEAYSPLGVVQVVQAQGLRSTAGLSLVSPFQVPVQKTIFCNGEGGSAITPYSGSPEDIGYLRYLTSYLPFYLATSGSRNRALIIGSGGGESILKTILAGFDRVDALEADQNVIDLMKTKFASFSGNIYDREKVNVLNREARNFIRHTQNRYDLIELSLIDAYNASASGVYGLNESYLFTVEAIKDYLSRLNDNGMLAVTRWVVTPARDNLKLFDTVIKALKETGVKNFQNHLIAVRSLQTLTLLVLKKEASAGLIDHTRSFAGNRRFDLVHYPGMMKKEANRHIRLEKPVYYSGIKKLMGPDAETFIKTYDFYIRAATDNQPYFYNFFKPRVIELILSFGPSQVPMTEWGYLLLLVILIPVLAISFLLIPAPILLFKKRPRKHKADVFFYFSFIGAGFFFIEMPLIQKMTLFLGQPVYAISVIIAALLVSSGMGSYFSDKIFPRRNRILTATILIAVLTCLYMLTLDSLFRELIRLGLGQRLCLSIFLAVSLGFFMGIPFPAGLELVKKLDRSLTAWAWGINGFFSVISILSATLLAVMVGFKAVLTAAALFYLTAGFISLNLLEQRSNPLDRL
ncbi:hypothetical protein [Desulfobacula sp.]|uniref:spermine/spermidine synthase domain-containing protein n=1 Tax=Desulfobacula sp. TaxID=2593537 RepID=UPI0026347D3E|nr:hypothetical protein [Desulfobacula sp.]